MNNRDRYQRSFSVLTDSHTPEWIIQEECAMNSNKRTGLRMSRKMLILVIMIIGIFALSGITYAATGRTIMYNVKLYFSDGTEKDIKVTSVIDESGKETVTGNEINEEFPLDENNEGSVRLEGDGWEFETGFYNPEADDEDQAEAQNQKMDQDQDAAQDQDETQDQD